MVKLTFSEEPEVSLPPPGGTGSPTPVITDEKPKRKPGRPPGSPNRASLESLEAQLKDKLLEDFVIPATIASPLLAANVEKRADRTAKAMVRIAARNPSVRKGLEKALQGSDILTIATFFLTSAVCVMVDFSMIAPDALPARAAGVPELWNIVYEEEPQQNGNGGGTRFRRGLLGEVE